MRPISLVLFIITVLFVVLPYILPLFSHIFKRKQPEIAQTLEMVEGDG
jgi:hypothetical protein